MSRLYKTIDGIERLKFRIIVEHENARSEIIFKWQEFLINRTGSILLTTNLDHDDAGNVDNILDLPGKVTRLAELVTKSRSKSLKDDIMVKRDNNKVSLSHDSTIGYWDAHLRPLESAFSQMNVVASLKSESTELINQADKKQEKIQDKVIFSLRLYQNGLLSLNPDVTTIKNIPHKIDLNNVTWKLWIENISEPLNTVDEEKEEKIYTEFYSRQASNSSINTLNFENPPLFSLRMRIFGEIVSGTGFEESPLYLKYEIKLPEHWEMEIGDCSDSLSGTSISSIVKSGKCYWSHPLDLTLICKDTLSPPSWPILNVVIYSHDYWNRHRIQGYAIIPFPRSSGCQTLQVYTWKPVETRENTLSNYFLGGSRLLDLNQLENSQRINRYGFLTETSGSLSIKWNVILSTESYSTKSDQSDLGNVSLAVLSTALSRAKARLKALKTKE